MAATQELPARTASDSGAKGQLAPISTLFQCADATDKLLMVVGMLAAIATGTSQPLQIVIFGDILNSFNQVPAPSSAGESGAAAVANQDPDAMMSGITKVAIRFVWLGVAVFFTGLAQVACWSITASRQVKRVREGYIHAILSQEIGWFDVNDPMTLATKVADRMLTIQDGMGRKVGEGINFAAMAVSGILIGLAKEWKLALALIALRMLHAVCSARWTASRSSTPRSAQ